MSEPVSTIDGWYSLHLLYSVDWAGLRVLDKDERNALTEELQAFLNRQEEVHEKHEGDYAFYNIMGHKADIIFWLLRPTADELIKLELEINKLRVADYLIPTYSYVSIIEMSSYLGGNKTPEEMMEIPHIQQRLYPSLEKSKYICFYPMDKKRDLQDNWYMLPMEERKQLMRDHGMIGRKYAGKIKQYITGSQGLDKYEWAVTLLSDDMLEFKKIIYEMRFDETSARYGVFGDFYVGGHIPNDAVADYFG
ncbi:hydrogen peroxide-dependent heme synthase [Jeotgalicoccus halotolerans]|uniref:hydrogen peroxide-dependent heme synthase n=1 Tax=Jeotgalicoccus halotolerans TaxID=157227 RepID=UPI0035154518